VSAAPQSGKLDVASGIAYTPFARLVLAVISTGPKSTPPTHPRHGKDTPKTRMMDEQRRPTPDQVLDATNLNCPLPILKTKRALGNVAIGGTLEVLATDPGSPDDFVAFAQSTGNTLIEQQLDDKGVFHFILRRDC